MSQVNLPTIETDIKDSNGSTTYNQIAQRFVRFIVEKSATPFERLADTFVQGQSTDAATFTYYMQYWRQNLSSKGEWERLERFIDFSGLSDADLRQMIAPAVLTPDAELPEWTEILMDLVVCETDPEIANEQSDIPFIHILAPYIQVFRNRLQKVAGPAYQNLSPKAHIQIERFLVQQLFKVFNKVLFAGFDEHLRASLGKGRLSEKAAELGDDHYYRMYVEKISADSLVPFLKEYPMLARFSANLLRQQITSFSTFMNRLAADSEQLSGHFGWRTDPGAIMNLKLGISDPHKGGEGVIILDFEGGQKLVYKPRCMKIGLAFNQLCAWVNERIQPALKILNIFSGDGYGWIEFCPHTECEDRAAVERYYERAGILLALTFILNSTDFHSENIIASGEHPVLVDHETLVNPPIKMNLDALDEAKKQEHLRQEASVLRAALLPMRFVSTNVPNDSISGFGSIGNGVFPINSAKYEDTNTDTMRLVSYTIDYEDRDNLPHLTGEIQRLPAYQTSLEAGFQRMYDIILAERECLLGPDSPLRHFAHLQLRFLFRSTTIYSVILKNLLKPDYLKDATLYGLRLELLGRAFVVKDEAPHFWPVLQMERQASLQQDVPCLEFSSSDTSLFVEGVPPINDYFKSDCMSYIQKKIKRMGPDDFAFQMDVIQKSIRGEFNQK
ncbi:MAG: type 2 lanthipeptide synthetase LanM [Bacteroidota bacterium]